MTEHEVFAYAIAGVSLVLAVISRVIAYRNGVIDGAFNLWLPNVKRIVEADPRWPGNQWSNDDEDDETE